MIGEGIQEEVLRALVEQHAVRECLVARVDGGALGAGALAAGKGAHLGEPDGGRTVRGRDQLARL